MGHERSTSSGWQSVYRGSIFEMQQNDKGWERAVRAPGVRIIIDDEESGKILLTREYREELGGYDYRLPGGKVFDSLSEYLDFQANDGDIESAATEKVKQESIEESGYEISNPELITRSVNGATVGWDLFVFATKDFRRHENGQRLERGEQIETDNWFAYDEIIEMLRRGDMQEGRIAFELWRYISNITGD